MNEHNNPASTIQTHCASCGVSRDRGERCEYCGALYPDTISTDAPTGVISSLDNKYRVKRNGNEVSISWSWRNIKTWMMIPFFIFWNSIAFQFTTLDKALSDPLSLFPVPGIHLLVGILGPLYVLLCLINNTTITANSSHLSIRHHPLPWRNSNHFSAGDIEQVFVSRGRRSSKKRSWDVPILQVITINGSRYELLKGQTEVEFADYESLRRHILTAMNIAPKKVHGSA